MSIPQSIVDQLMVKCGRRCCICRRFAPTHLQVHHIVEVGEGGSDDPDNLIPACLTCHSDVHTNTKLTRRFTVNELKGHREAVFAAVANGTLSSDIDISAADGIISRVVKSLAAAPLSPSLKPRAIELLLKAVPPENEGQIMDFFGGAGNSGRQQAELHAAIQELQAADLIEYVSGSLYLVTERGYLFADEIMTARGGKITE